MKTKTNRLWMSFGHLLKSTMKLLAAAVLAGGMLKAASAQDSITVADPSFEAGYNPTWPHYVNSLPFGGAWNTSTLGIGNNDVSGPFWDNGGAVDGTYVAFVQDDGVIVQTLTNFQVGETYWIQFFANARVGSDTPDVSVLEVAGGNVWLKTMQITPVGGVAGTGNPFVLFNAMMTATTNTGYLYINKGSHDGTNDGNSTLLLDGVSVIKRSANDVVIGNPSFEASGTGQTAPGYMTAIAGWTHVGAGQMAINQAGGTFADNGALPDGGNVLCLTSGAGVSQTLSVNSGMKYQLSFYANSQAAGATPTARVTIGGSTAYNGSVPAVGGSNPYQTLTYTFTAASSSVTLTISNATGSASALLVDNVRLVKLPDSINVANPSFESGYETNWPHYGLIPGWSTSSTALGLNNASGPFWDNGATVDSTYVGFVQHPGLLGQATSGFEVGETYWIQFFANARAAEADTPDIAVYHSASTAGFAPIVSGINITPAGGAAGSGNPFTLINVPFTAAATSGDLNLAKSEHSSGGSTLLLDGFSIIRRSTNDIVIMNPSFEASGTGQAGLGIVAAVAGWTLTGAGPYLINQAGMAYLDSGEVAPDGQNVLVIQQVSAFSQTLHGLTVGKSYRLTLYVNGRGGPQPTALITIDGQTAYNAPVPQLGSQPFHLVSYDFIASAADVTLSIGGTGRNSYFVDDVRVYAPTPIPPTVDTQPVGATRYAGGAFTFTASVSGYPTPQLQWKRNGANLPGATNATLVLSNLQLAAAGSYVLTATNYAGGTNSSAATLTVLPVTSSYATAVVAQNPMGYWRFSDGGGTNAYDYAGGNNAYDTNYQNNGGSGPATLGAGPQSPTFPGFESTNTAPFLDGFSQGYQSSVSLFNNRSNFTLIGWFKIDPSQYPIAVDPFAHPDGRASLFGQQWAAELGFYQGTNLYFYATGITPGTILVTSGFNPGVWHFVAAVSDAGANTTKVYLDGVLAGSANACPGTTNSYLFSIGKNVAYWPSGGYDNAFFPGSLDEVAAFDHALSASAIQAIYQASSSFSISIQPQGGGLQVIWPVGRLLSATNVNGPWTTNTGAVSPLSVTPNAARMFYRAVNP